MIVRVVFHIDDVSKWSLLLMNVQNLAREVDLKASRLEVVANAAAVEFYTWTANKKDADSIRELAGMGVRFVACSNALRGMEISEEHLARFVEVVPSGVLELIERQGEGYAYIKP